MATGIEWTDETWNPLTGCSHVSPGCDNCYAARDTAGRLQHHAAYAGLAVRSGRGPAKFTGEIRLHNDRLEQPLRWRKPRRVFVNSMSDLFHSDVPMEFILRVWAVMMNAPEHTFQVLTKRPQRMQRIVSAICWERSTENEPWDAYESDLAGGGEVPVENVWVGTSIESDRYCFRADHLRATPAAVRFLSLEPLLGPVPSLDLTGIDWVIVGGESGPDARPMHPDWVRDIRDRCVEERRWRAVQAVDARHGYTLEHSHSPEAHAQEYDEEEKRHGPAFFFKQWGEWVAPGQFDSVGWDDVVMNEHGTCVDYERVWRVGKKAAGRMLDGRTWDEQPERRQ